MQVFLMATLLFGLSDISQATIINLNDFFSDPTVTVAGDGSSAILAEDPNLFSVILNNDPFFGDPNVIAPGAGVSLIFDYMFSEGASNDDEFFAFVLDSATGFSAGTEFEFSSTSSSSGTVAFDLSSLTSLTLGLSFELVAFDFFTDSTVAVSNVRLETVTVAEPGILWLLGAGLIGLMVNIRLINKCVP